MPFTPVERRLNRIGFALLLAWMLATLVLPLVSTVFPIPLDSASHSTVYAHGHGFVDARTLWGVANAMDVLSNLPFVLGGLWGLWALRRTGVAGAPLAAVRTFFAGLVLTGLASAWYHLAPDSSSLVVDRLGMAVTFAGAIALAVCERVGACAARSALRLALVLALLSAVMPYSHGNVWPWAVVQFGGMALMLWLALQKPVAGALGVRLGLLLALYALAKGLEWADAPIFLATGEAVSGHSLKHLVAALAVWPVLRALRQNALACAAAPLRRQGCPCVDHPP